MSDASLRKALVEFVQRYERLARELSVRSGDVGVVDVPLELLRDLLAAHPETDDGAAGPPAVAAAAAEVTPPAAPSSLTLDRDAVREALAVVRVEIDRNAHYVGDALRIIDDHLAGLRAGDVS